MQTAEFTSESRMLSLEKRAARADGMEICVPITRGYGSLTRPQIAVAAYPPHFLTDSVCDEVRQVPITAKTLIS